MTWVKAGFWWIRGAMEEGEPRRSVLARGWKGLYAIDVMRDRPVELHPPDEASAPLRYVQVA